MRLVFMGTPEFALPPLERLIESRHDIRLVVTQPDRPRGRGRKLEPTPVKQLAEAHGLRVIQPESLRREPIDDLIRAEAADLGVVVAFGQILPPDVLAAPRLGCINIHASLLPRYRGAAPIQRAILDGESETGVTIMQMEAGLDTGPIIAQQSVEILDDDDARSVADMLSVLGAEMLLRVLDEIEVSGEIESEPQDESQATWASAIRKEEGLIPWHDTTESIMYRLRAMTPWPGAHTYYKGRQHLGIVQAEPVWPNEAAELDEMFPDVQPGVVTSLRKGYGFTVRTGDGHLLVTAVQPAGKARMDAAAFINGHPISPGDWLGPRDEEL